jgi:hypothetical protein
LVCTADSQRPHPTRIDHAANYIVVFESGAILGIPQKIEQQAPAAGPARALFRDAR